METETINNRYLLRSVLGTGGMGAVYRAYDRLTGEELALKQVTTPPVRLGFASRAGDLNLHIALAQEFKTLTSLRHPNIVSVRDYGFDEQRQPFFTMDLLEDANTIIEAGQGQTVDTQVDMLIQLLQALAYLHRRRVLHRDLKPGNVLVVNGQVKVLDFGLSLITERSVADITQSTTGTFAYMAPELFQGMSPSTRSDLYAVGVLAFELFAGQHPFHTDNIAFLISKILTAPLDVDLLNVNDAIVVVITRLLDRSAEERYKNANDTIKALCIATGKEFPKETESIRESYLQAAEFVGREDETRQLVEAMTAAQSGDGSTWLVGGESGVGKTRLLEEVRTQAMVEGMLVLEGQAVSEGSTPYQVWLEVLRRLCLTADLSDLEAGVLKILVPDISSLLEREVSNAPPLAPKAAYKRLLKVVVDLLQRSSQPLVIILEDLQWAGNESVGLLSHLTTHLEEAALLLLASYRDEERPHLPAELPYMKNLTLARLSTNEITALSESMLGSAGREPVLIEFLQRETEGNAYFLIEVVRSLAEEAGQLDRIGDMRLPKTISAEGILKVIERRLQRVDMPSHSLLPLAALIGRQLDVELLRHLNPQTDIEAWLNKSAEARVLEVHEGSWRFAHDKLREVVISNLAFEEQKKLHLQIAEAIEQYYWVDLAPFYSRLANHWSKVVEDEPPELAQVEKAIDYLNKAGLQAKDNFASQEAIEYFNQAITLLNTLPDSTERAQQELDSQTALGSILLATKGYGAPEVKQTYDRSRKLCQQMGETPQLFQVLWGLCRFYLVRTPLQICRELGEQLLNLAQKQQDPTLLLEAYNSLGAALSHLGDLSQAQTYLERGLDIYNPRQHGSHALIYGQDPGIVCLSRMTWTLWCLGFPEQALGRKRQALALASELAHPFSKAFALVCVAILHQLRREVQATQEQAEATICLCTEQGFDFFRAMGVCLHGWALFSKGQTTEGIAQLRQGIEAWKATGAVLFMPYYLAMLAEMYSEIGQTEASLATLAEALSMVDKSGERFWEAEIYRLKGELLLKEQGDRTVMSAVEVWNAEHELSPKDYFNKAIDIARCQSGKSLELRATVSLCRLWQSQGKQEAARQMLTRIYDWFTEGFDTEDLKKAKALLKELS